MKLWAVGILVGLWLAGTGTSAVAGVLSETFKRVKSSVVVVKTESQGLVAGPDGTQAATREGIGSGVLISTSGKVLTAAHVVQAADQVLVEFANGEETPARVTGSVPAADLALLQLAHVPASIQPAPLGDSDAAEVGDEIFIVGAPLGISYTLTVGHVSARRRDDRLSSSMLPVELFQTDAAINQGNSGGPMFNLAGEVIGVVSHMVSRSGGYEGLGFAVTSRVARELLIEQPSVWTGVEGYVLDGGLAAALNVPQERALLVQRVARGSSAANMGLRGGTLPARIGEEELLLGGDVILTVGGIDTSSPENLPEIRRRMSRMIAGDEVTLRVLRGGEVIVLSALR